MRIRPMAMRSAKGDAQQLDAERHANTPPSRNGISRRPHGLSARRNKRRGISCLNSGDDRSLMGIPILGELPSVTDWIAIVVISIGVYIVSGGPLSGKILRLQFSDARSR